VFVPSSRCAVPAGPAVCGNSPPARGNPGADRARLAPQALPTILPIQGRCRSAPEAEPRALQIELTDAEFEALR